ncbi:hypothetical protein [Cytobacillus solani]|uniref:Uncharacterized protein n=1 Tax=Cytobacillus solani TaxID=1637975 RepID=A0A0Q3QLD7_9BACI|nr:hypothetical protein [Cytobacillus solani]KQL18809.1 hypothetical protein AN957_09645 [Cytobacillus solani]
MPKKVAAKDWRNREQADWTIATFQQYLKDAHEERYGIAYTTRSYGLEGRWLKTLIAEHGAEVVRKFIDACFAEYRPTPQYPGLNFAFMFTYQRGRVLPRVLAEQARKTKAQATAAPITEEEIGWL